MEESIAKAPLFSNRKLVSMAIPLILNAVLSILVGFVDSVMVSSAGEAAVSAISLVDSLNLMFVGMFISLAAGGSIVTTQYLGAGDTEHARASARQLLYLVLGISLVFMLPLLCLIPQVLRLVYGGIEADVYEHAKGYFFWTLLGYPLVAVGNVCAALLRAMTKNKEAVGLSICSNVVNIIGNAVLIYGFDLGAAGAGMATTIGRACMAAAGMHLLRKKDQPLRFEKLLELRFDRDIMGRVARIGVANGMENFLFKLGRVLVSSMVATLGTAAIAANSVANTVGNLGWEVEGAMGSVLLIVVAQCVGAGETKQAKYYTKKLLRVAVIMMLAIFSGTFLLRHQVVRLFDFEPEQLQICAEYVGVMSIITIVSVHAFVFVPKSAFRAAGDIRYTMVLSLSSMFVFRVGVGCLLTVVLDMGLLGIWIGMGADFACQSLCNFIHLRGGKWLKRKMI